MFNFIDIYSFIPVSSIAMGPSALLCLREYNAVKTVLNKTQGTRRQYTSIRRIKQRFIIHIYIDSKCTECGIKLNTIIY
jgi:hypothetical protein